MKVEASKPILKVVQEVSSINISKERISPYFMPR